MKIVSSGRVLNSSGFYKKKQRRRRVQLVFVSIGFILLISSLIYFSRHERFQVGEVVVLGEEVADREKIISTTKESLTGYYLRIIPKANAFLYPRRAIKENLFKEFPRFKSVDLNVKDRTLLVELDERTPFALYCTNTSLSECYFIDEDGFIFAPAPSFSGVVYFLYILKDPVENPLGKRFMTIEEFRPLPRFIETLAVLNIYPVALEIGDDEYSLVLASGGKIIWRRDNNLALVYANLEAFLSDDNIRAQDGFLDKILQLDLRTENKVFYKFK